MPRRLMTRVETREERKRKRKKTSKQHTSNSSKLVEEATPQILFLDAIVCCPVSGQKKVNSVIFDGILTLRPPKRSVGKKRTSPLSTDGLGGLFG